jgi:hypothetical protein
MRLGDPATVRSNPHKLTPVPLGAADWLEGPLTALPRHYVPPRRMTRFAPHLPFAYSSGSAQLGGFLRFQICAAFDTHGLKAVI